MSKHKTVKKWVACLDNCGTEESKVKCFPVQVVETKKQYRLPTEDDGYYSAKARAAHKACGWRGTFHKENNDCLFDTKQEAIVNLVSKCLKSSERARIKYNRARIDCDKVKAAHAALYGEWE